jgi:hypothetical protein
MGSSNTCSNKDLQVAVQGPGGVMDVVVLTFSVFSLPRLLTFSSFTVSVGGFLSASSCWKCQCSGRSCSWKIRYPRSWFLPNSVFWSIVLTLTLAGCRRDLTFLPSSWDSRLEQHRLGCVACLLFPSPPLTLSHQQPSLLCPVESSSTFDTNSDTATITDAPGVVAGLVARDQSLAPNPYLRNDRVDNRSARTFAALGPGASVSSHLQVWDRGGVAIGSGGSATSVAGGRQVRLLASSPRFPPKFTQMLFPLQLNSSCSGVAASSVGVAGGQAQRHIGDGRTVRSSF